ncbi:MAG: hypothetical protein ICV74_04145 [Thermoleophilia bacterium]|nr:hypothetical protein [Thermoleophilia bacterium]
MPRKTLLLASLAAGAVAALVARRRFALEERGSPALDPRAEELRAKLEQAREQAADEEDFEAAGMAAETVVDDEEPPGAEAARRLARERARKAAEEMRGSGESTP